MAALSKNTWYQWYIREGEAGRLELPEYEEDEDSCLYLYYGEVFCRIVDCSKVTHNYKTTNNLRTHIGSHKDTALPEGSKGGRVSQELIDEAASIVPNCLLTACRLANNWLEWYKGLFGGVAPGSTSNPAATTASTTTPGATTLPALPKKKDKTVHVTNMRAEVVRMGYSVPCNACGSRVNCCKDINKCEHFILFDCGDLHPRAATVEPENPGNDDEGTA